MIVDTDGSSCVTVNFGIGDSSDSRQWDIMVNIIQRRRPCKSLLLIQNSDSKYVLKCFLQWLQTTQYRCGEEAGGKYY